MPKRERLDLPGVSRLEPQPVGRPSLPAMSWGLAAKLGSILVHVEEGASMNGHAFDWIATKPLLADPEVVAWLGELRKLALVPVKRNKT